MSASKQKISSLTATAQRATLLRDGTPVDSLIDRERREVSLRLMSDPEIYQLELERIWAKQWIVVGHESEIPNSGDFVTRKVGDDPVILVRTRDGSIQCLLNVCPHRGAMVCRSEAGNAPLLRCLYHGWMFNLDGSLRGAPFKDEIYSDCEEIANVRMERARVSVFAGIIFMNWDESAPALDDYLEDFRFYLKLVYDRTDRGLEVLGPPQRFIVPANWKTAAEQFGGDGYHAGQLHRSLGELVNAPMSDARVSQMHAPKVSTVNGHNIICFDMRDMFSAISGGKELTVAEKLSIMPPPGVPRELVPQVLSKLTQNELEFLANTPPSNGGIFPNVGIWNTTAPGADRLPAPFLSLRTYVPLGPDHFEFCMWVLVARDADEEYRERLRRTTSFMQGAAGFIEGDDGEVWPSQTQASRGHIARQRSSLKYWALAGDHPPEGWPAGGRVHTPFCKDDSQWNWWNRYFDLMAAKA